MSQLVIEPDDKFGVLTQAAILRATCPLERGREWIEWGTHIVDNQ